MYKEPPPKLYNQDVSTKRRTSLSNTFDKITYTEKLIKSRVVLKMIDIKTLNGIRKIANNLIIVAQFMGSLRDIPENCNRNSNEPQSKK